MPYTKVPSPLFISSRLMAAVKLPDGSTVHVGHVGMADDGRQSYGWAIDGPDGAEVGAGADLSSGVGADVDYLDTMRSLLSFLGAAGEAFMFGPDAECYDLFPAAVTEWAHQNSDEIGMLAFELECQVSA